MADTISDDFLNEAYDLGYESCMRDHHIKHSNEQKTNADRIRAMTDEELAKWIIKNGRSFGEEYEGEMSCLDWLKEEVDE